MIIGAGVLQAAVLWRLHTEHGGWKSTGAKNSGGEKKSPGIQWFSEKLFCGHYHVVSSKEKCHISVGTRPRQGQTD